MIKVSRDGFLQMLGRVQPGLSKRGTVEQSKSIVFGGGWASTFSGEICVRTQSGLPEDVEGAVPAEPLAKWVEGLKSEDELEIEVKDNQFKLRAGRKRATLRTELATLALEDVSLPSKWTKLPEDFSQAVELVAATAGGSRDPFRSRCVHLHSDFLESCDSSRCTRYTLDTGLSEPCLVLAETLVQMVPLNLTKMGTTSDWLHFRLPEVIFSCRLHLEDYPTNAVTKLLGFEGTSCSFPKGVEVSAKLGQVFCSDKDNDKLTVTLDTGLMKVRGEGPHGWCEEDMELSYSGPPLSFRIKPLALVQLVKEHDTCQVSDGRLKVQGDKWCFVTALGKVADGVMVPVPDDEDAEDYDGDDPSDDE